MVWGKAGSTTLTTTGDTITVSGTTASDFNQTLSHVIQTSSNIRMATRVGNGSIDSGSNYANGSSENGGAKSNATSQTYHKNSGSVPSDMFAINYAVNIATEEKLFISHNVVRSTAGAGTAPQRMESVGKWANTSDQFNYIETVNDQAGDYTTDSNLSVLGSDITPAAAITFPTNVQTGSRAEITDTRKMYYRIDSDYETDKWFEVGTVPYAGGRGVFGGGTDGSITNTMEYITIATPSNATDFGDLTVARLYVEAVSSITRGVFGGGWNGSANQDTMDYITFATPSNATDFGNLTVARHALAGVSSGTRGVFGGGNVGSNVMDYITIATPSNATDFGDLTVTRQDLAGVSSDTRGVFAGGDTSNVMDYITISTASNATDFGDLLSNLRYPADISNGTRGVFAGGDPNSAQGNTNVIQYITIATTGNATDFGDLTVGRHAPAGVESDTRGVIGGGATGSGTGTYSNVMDYITIATTGNATDFGDLTAATNHLGGASRF